MAGNGSLDWFDATGTNAKFKYPSGVAVDLEGNVYVADSENHRIRKISPSGKVETLAGNGNYTFADGTGMNASFKSPSGIAIDKEGNIYVADTDNHRIRKINPSGQVETLAGNGSAEFADGIGTNAKFIQPSGIAVDAQGIIYVADKGNNRIRRIDPVSKKVTTLAGSGEANFADGIGTDAKFNAPWGIAVDAKGILYVAEYSNARIRKIDPISAKVTTLAGNGEFAFADGIGTGAKFYYPSGITVDAQGIIYVADTSNDRIRKIDPVSAKVTTLAGSGESDFADGIGINAKFDSPEGITVDKNGIIYVGDTRNHRIRKIE
ncbi:MAG: NHL repeat-containing protein [Daejeonella sp.]